MRGAYSNAKKVGVSSGQFKFPACLFIISSHISLGHANVNYRRNFFTMVNFIPHHDEYDLYFIYFMTTDRV